MERKEPARSFFVIIRSVPEIHASTILLKDLYDDDNEHMIGSYPDKTDKTAFIVFSAIKTVLRELKNASRV